MVVVVMMMMKELISWPVRERIIELGAVGKVSLEEVCHSEEDARDLDV